MDVIRDSKSITFLIGYVSIVLLDFLFGSIGLDELRLLSKPMILISLTLYFVYNGRHLPKKIFLYTLLALCFSLLGDIMLLFDHQNSSFFVIGLVAFLLAHISYTLVFIKQGSTSALKGFWWVLAALLIYGLVLYIILMGHLGALKVPVIIYIMAILAMALTAYNRKEKVKKGSFISVLIGALFFIMSDSILAINKFLFTVPGSHLLVMGTYAAAQYLIICGLLGSKHHNISSL